MSKNHRVFQWLSEREREQLRRLSKRVFGRGRLALRLEHFFYRMRSPRFPSAFGTFLLLLSPVQYELAPILRSDKAITIRQKLEHFLVKRCVPSAFRDGAKPPRIVLEISDADDERLAKEILDSLALIQQNMD